MVNQYFFYSWELKTSDAIFSFFILSFEFPCIQKFIIHINKKSGDNKIARARLIFEKFDKDKNGTIETGELRIALIEFGITPTEELITEMVYNLYIK